MPLFFFKFAVLPVGAYRYGIKPEPRQSHFNGHALVAHKPPLPAPLFNLSAQPDNGGIFCALIVIAASVQR